jgi:hypothetical protein
MRRLALGFAAIGLSTACQLVDPPSDVTGGSPPAGPGSTDVDGNAGSDEASAESGGGGRILCSSDPSGVAPYCPAGTEACCYTDPTGPGTCGTAASCASSALFLCSGFEGCPSTQVCCAISMFVAFDGADYNALGGAVCTDPATCSADSFSQVLCTIADDRCSTLGPPGSSCQPWSTATGGRFPLGYWSCQ